MITQRKIVTVYLTFEWKLRLLRAFSSCFAKACLHSLPLGLKSPHISPKPATVLATSKLS